MNEGQVTMNKYLDELESDISELRTRLDYVESSFDNMKEDFECMETQLEDIESIIDSEYLNKKEIISRIQKILAR